MGEWVRRLDPGGTKKAPCPWKHFPIYMMARTLFTPSVDSKGAAGEQKCDDNGAKNSLPELKEKRDAIAEEGGFTY